MTMAVHVENPVESVGIAGTVTVDGSVSIAAFPDDEVPVIDWPHEMVHAGKSFTFTEVVALGNNGVQDYLLTVGAKEPNFDYELEATYGITLELYAETGKTQSAAAEVTHNRNRNSLNASVMTVKKGTNGGSGDGTRILWRKSGSGTSQGKLAAGTISRKERILKQNVRYIFRITSAAASNDVSVQLDWYEE
jgi:hypothetical protein